MLPDLNSSGDAALLETLELLEEGGKERAEGSSRCKKVELFDEWEQFSIRFSVYYPINNDQKEYLQL